MEANSLVLKKLEFDKLEYKGMLYDFYGELLTQHQKKIYEDAVFNDLSLGEIADEQGISRQGVHDNLSRAEALLRNMEEKTGCVRRDLACRKAAQEILEMAQKLLEHEDLQVSAMGRQIMAAAEKLGE